MKKHDKNEKRFDIYFYNGFGKPELVAASIEEFKEEVSVFQHSLLLDDTGTEETDEVIEALEEYKAGRIYTEEIGNSIFVNPTLEELKAANRSWFSEKDILTYLDDFIES